MKADTYIVEKLHLLGITGKTELVEAVNPNQRILMELPFVAEPFDLIRREKGGA
jgi:hypothetical protein